MYTFDLTTLVSKKNSKFIKNANVVNFVILWKVGFEQMVRSQEVQRGK